MTYKQIGDRLDAVIARVGGVLRQQNRYGTVVINGCIRGPPFLGTMGHQDCLFGKSYDETCGMGSSLIKITSDDVPGRALENVTELHGHLIRDHHFFQGSLSLSIWEY